MNEATDVPKRKFWRVSEVADQPEVGHDWVYRYFCTVPCVLLHPSASHQLGTKRKRMIMRIPEDVLDRVKRKFGVSTSARYERAQERNQRRQINTVPRDISLISTRSLDRVALALLREWVCDEGFFRLARQTPNHVNRTRTGNTGRQA